MNPSGALDVADDADQESGAQELLRIWTTDAGERVALYVHDQLPVAAWGILLP
jgi:hypothetical protein